MRFVLERHRLYRTLVVAGIVAAILIFLFFLYNESPMKKGKSILYIPASTLEDVSTSLEKSGYKLNRWDRFALYFVTLPEEGWYRLDGNIVGRFFFLKDLHTKHAHTINIKIFAGETIDELLRRLSRDMILSQAKLKEYYREMSRFEEGNILADRYTIARAANEETVMRFLFEQSNKQIDSFAKEQYGEDQNVSKKLLDTLIIASIIQRESNDIEEMPKISSVIHNRLEKNMRLQMDGTLNYGKYARTIVTPERIRTDTSRYNTYKYKGLPPAPLGSVSIDAIKAAANPAKTNYLFFVLNKEGKHDFVGSYQKHLKNVKIYKQHLRENKEEPLVLENKLSNTNQTPSTNSTETNNTISQNPNKTLETKKTIPKNPQHSKQTKKSNGELKKSEQTSLDITPKEPIKTDQNRSDIKLDQEQNKSNVTKLFENLDKNNSSEITPELDENKSKQ